MRDRELDNPPSNAEFPTGLHLDLLGTFCLRRDGQPVAGLEHARLQHLLAYLVLHRDIPIARQQLAFLFWPESTDSQALKNLRTLLTRLRRALPDIERYLDVHSQNIQWHSDASFTIDVAAFESAIAQAAGAQETKDYTETVSQLSSAVAGYTGDLLPGCYDDWILPLRDRLYRSCGDASERLVLLLEEHRAYGEALTYALRLLNHDPLHEAAYHHLIRLHLALGDRTEALRVCRACETMLKSEFGTSLTRETRELYQQLLETGASRVGLEQPLAGHTSTLPLLGREVEWPRLISAWKAASAGHPQMVLLSGEAGIGKTRLAEELCAWVTRQGAAVAIANCYPAGGIALAYAPVAEWLRSPAIQSRLDGLNELWLVEIARVLPTLLVDRPQLKSPGPLTEAWQRARLFEALANAVLGPDANQPVLLFLDDLQWCDQETLDWLGYLLRFARNAPLLVLAAVRKFEIDRVHPLLAFWYALTRSGLLTEIPLNPLNSEDTGLLAASVAGRTIAAWEAAQIYHHTEGNPLFVVEIAQTGLANELDQGFAEEGLQGVKSLPAPMVLSPAPVAFPPKVRAVIQERLAQLSPPAQALAQIAAVIGHEFRFDLLAQASGLENSTVLEMLDELWQRGIVRAKTSQSYDFTHDGIRAVAYDDTGPFHRRAAHLRVAQALEKIHQEYLDPVSIQIASHYEQAGQIQPAVAFYRRAASAAERVYASAAAARLFQHLLESELNTGLNRADKSAVMLALAVAWRATGQWVQAEAIIRKVLTEAEALGDSHLLAQAKCVLADVLHRLGYYDAALQWLAEAEQGFQAEGDLRGAAGTLRIRGEICWLLGDHLQALAALQRQLDLAAEIKDPYSAVEAHEALGMVLWSQGDWQLAAEHCLNSIRIAGPLGYKPLLTRASITLGNIRTGEHWFGEAVYWYQHAAAIARETGDPQVLSWAVYSIAQILVKRGDDRRASSGFARSLCSAWEIGDRMTACLNVAGLATVHGFRGETGEAKSLYRLAVNMGMRLNIPSYLSGMLVELAWLLLEQSRAEEARAAYNEALNQIYSLTGERLAGEDTRFDVQMLGIRLRDILGEQSRTDAVAEIRALLQSADTPQRQAALHDALWQMAPEDEDARLAAAEWYRTSYTETWTYQYRQRYQDLTGELLPDPPPLPDISDFIPDQETTVSLESILGQIRAAYPEN